jgi:hypothetical protein
MGKLLVQMRAACVSGDCGFAPVALKEMLQQDHEQCIRREGEHLFISPFIMFLSPTIFQRKWEIFQEFFRMTNFLLSQSEYFPPLMKPNS